MTVVGLIEPTKLWPASQLNRGLVGEWAFSRNSGLIVPDSSDSGADGTFVNAAASGWIGTDRGPAFSFDGSDDYINIGNPAQLNFGTGSFALEVLFRTTTDSSTFRVLFSKVSSTGNSGFSLRKNVSSTALQLVLDDSATHTVTGSTAINDGAWYHVVAQRKSGGGLYLYVNAVIDGTDADGDTDVSGNESVNIGRREEAAAGYWLGEIALVRAYSRLLTVREIRARYEICSARASGAASFWVPPYAVAGAEPPSGNPWYYYMQRRRTA